MAFADSSIVVLALPDLYGAFDTSIVGVSWVITSYNVAVGLVAFALVPAARRLDARKLTRIGLVLFTFGSVGCAAAWVLEALIAWRCVQGIGGALLLAGSLRLLAAPAWTTVGTLGAAAGPALGGVLTQLFDWRAIFVVQAPVAAAAFLLATRVTAPPPEPSRRRRRRGALAADAGLALVFAALVGALFLAVLLVITVWQLEPLAGAAVVSALPIAALLVRPAARRLPAVSAVTTGALLLGGGLAGLALLPRVSNVLVAVCLAFCGAGVGLAVPALTAAALDGEAGVVRSGALTVAWRHAGLVLALALVAPLLTNALEDGGRRALFGATRVILEGHVGLTKKVPIALDLRDALEAAPKGEVPDLAKPFDDRGAQSDEGLRRLRDTLVNTLEAAITRGFRSSFALAALFAVLAIAPALRLRSTA